MSTEKKKRRKKPPPPPPLLLLLLLTTKDSKKQTGVKVDKDRRSNGGSLTKVIGQAWDVVRCGEMEGHW